MISFRTKKDKERLLHKAKEMESYAAELVECLEEARHGEYYDDDDDEYSERSERSMRMRGGRYGYMRK